MKKTRSLALLLCSLLAALLLLVPHPARADEPIDFGDVSIVQYDEAWYTGEPAYPDIRLEYGDETLEEGTDYYCTYTEEYSPYDTNWIEPIELGVYTVHFHPLGRFTGEEKNTWFYVYDPHDISSSSVQQSVSDYAYDGQPYTPVPEYIGIHDEDIFLGEGYELDCYQIWQEDDEGYGEWQTVDQPIEIGVYRGIIRGIGDYYGTNDFTFEIVDEHDITHGHFYMPDAYYAGSPLRPKLTVYNMFYNILVEGTDYEIVGYYRDDDDEQNILSQIVELGSYYVRVRGIGAWHGTVDLYFDVFDAYDISNADATVDSCLYQNAPVYPSVALDMGSVRLERGTEYTVSFIDANGRVAQAPDAPGEWTAAFEGVSPYYGSQNVWFEVIDAYDLNNGYAYLLSEYLDATTNEPTYAVNIQDTTVPKSSTTVTYATEDGTPVSPSQFVMGNDYVATISGVAPYHGQTSLTFTAYDQSYLYPAEVRLSTRQLTETGSVVKPLVGVFSNGNLLVEGRDYTLSFYRDDSDNQEEEVEPIEPGYYRVVVKAVPGSGYIGQAGVEPVFRIIGVKQIDSSMITGPSSSTAKYTGSSINPGITVTMDGTRLVAGRDYYLEYYSNSSGSYVPAIVDPGLYWIYVTGLTPYTGTRIYAGELRVTDGPINLNDMSVSLGKREYAYTGSPIYPEVIAYNDDVALREGTDYTLIYESDPAPSARGAHTVLVTGIGEYTGTVHLTYFIQTSMDVALATISGMNDGYTYAVTGEEIKPHPTVTAADGTTLRENVDYVITYACYSSTGTPFVDESECRLTITGCGDYTGEQSLNYHIVDNRTDISGAVVELSPSSYVFDGDPKRPDVTVTLDGQVLPTSAYAVSYADNTNVGTATVTVTGVGNYSGSVTATFQITEYEPQNYDELLDKLNRELTAAKAGAESAVAAQQQAAADLQSAEDAFAEAGEEYSAAKADVDTKQQALNDATADRDAKQQALDAANEAVDANASDIANAQTALDAAQTEESAKQQAVADADAAVSEAQANVNAKQQAVNAAQAAVSQLDAQGSVGFFLAKGSTLEASYLTNTSTVEYSTNTTYASHTNIGSLTDATAFQNMLDALDWIDYCNQIRADNGLSALKVTDGMMASAQRNANFSTFHYGHALSAPSRMDMAETRRWAGAENLYYTGIGVESAYHGWYTQEKEVWESLLAAHPEAAQYWLDSSSVKNVYGVTVGHYFNIVNPIYTITGIGLNSDYYDGAAIQQFAQDNGNSGTIYTVDEYRQRLLGYYNTDALDAANSDLASAQSALADAEQAKQQAESEYASAQQATQAARDALATEMGKTAALVSAAQAAQSALDTANNNVTAAQQAYNQAKAALDALDADGSLTRLSEELDQARAAKQAADQAAAEAQAPVDAAQARLDEAGNLADVAIGGVVDKVYNGSAQTQDLSVTKTFEGKDYQLSEPSHYTVSYASNTNAGTATVTVKGVDKQGAGKTWGSAQTTFLIDKINLSDAVVTAPDVTYNGNWLRPGAKVTLNGAQLPSWAYTVDYTNNQNVGTANIIVKGRGNYKGIASGHFNILGVDLTGATVTLEYTSATYTGDPIYPNVTEVKVNGSTVDPSGYTVGYANNTEEGTATVTVTGKGNYTGSAQATFAISKIDLSGARVVLEYSSANYTGKELRPNVTVILDGTTLDSSAYAVTYANNTNVGTATVTVTGQGSYKGSAQATFAIVRDSRTDISGGSIDPIADQYYCGRELKPELTVRVGGRVLRQGTDYRAVYSDSTNAGTAHVTVTGVGNYKGALSGTFVIHFFTDVIEKPVDQGGTPHWEHINWLAGTGVTTGWEMPDGTRVYHGDWSVVRQDMAAFMYRLAGGDAMGYVPTARDKARFSDVDENTPHHKEIWWMGAKGISMGYLMPDGTREFRGDWPVYRQDMAAFLRNVDRYMGGDATLPVNVSNPFKDVAPWTPHYEDILWLADAGVSTGWTEENGMKSYRGWEVVVRQDMAAFLHRLSDHVARTK